MFRQWMFKAIFVALALLAAGRASPALAQQKLEGWFIALQSCEAFQSKNQMTNPGDVEVKDHVAYDIIAINAPGGAWYQVRIPGAPVTDARWVSASCGVHVTAAGPMPQPMPGTPMAMEPVEGSEATDLLLTLSWQPAFCETKPSKKECQLLNDGMLPITETQLSLHGLWPQPNGNFYCGVPKALQDLDRQSRWSELPAPTLDAATRERLDVAMPGTASFLERHEWIKHGTCFFGGNDGQTYFTAALDSLDAVNGAVAPLLASHVGAEVTADAVRAAFDAAFGGGAGDRVQLKCTGDQGRVLLQEITINLNGKLSAGGDLGAVIRAAAPQSPGCSKGVVDPTGLQ